MQPSVWTLPFLATPDALYAETCAPVSHKWGTEERSLEGQRNSILQKAITLYVGQV